MHVNLLPIALVSTDNRSDNNQGIPSDKVSYTSLADIVGFPGLELELEGVAKRGQKEKTADEPQ